MNLVCIELWRQLNGATETITRTVPFARLKIKGSNKAKKFCGPESLKKYPRRRPSKGSWSPRETRKAIVDLVMCSYYQRALRLWV